MSSPRKRMKLTPKKDKSDLELRYDQESKVTSTPHRKSANICPSDVSTVSSIQKLSDSSIAESTSSSSSTSSRSPISAAESEKSGVLAVEDYNAYIDACQKIKYKGKIWTLHRPSHEDTLYAQIIQNPRDIKNVVTELLILYGSNPEQAICSLLKFCVDVCGFQNFEVANHYNFPTVNSKMMIEIMESSRTLQEQKILIDSGRYLYMEPSTALAQFLKISTYSFLQQLIMEAHKRGILYDDFFPKHFFAFVKCMSGSRISAIRHTGVIFGIKILTAVVMIYSNMEQDESSSDSSYNVEEQKREIIGFLDFFYFIFAKNCRLQDKKLVQMRIECIYELTIWVRHFPKIFISQLQILNYLVRLITDYSKNVRFATLETCEAFINTPVILSFLKQSNPDFIDNIGKRFYDVDMQVAIKALDIYRNLLKRDQSLISKERFKMIMCMVFDESFPIGEAAAKFLVYYLEATEDDEEAVLLQLANFSMKPGDAIKQLLVEGCLSSCSEIHNWTLYINIFLNRNVEVDIKNHLAQLFAEAVHQVLIGESTILRERSRKVIVIDTDEHRKVASNFPSLCTLLDRYADHPKIVTEFLKILTTVRDTVLNEVSLRWLKKICTTMKDLIYNHSDETLLKKLGETFHYFSKCTAHADHVQSVVEDISVKYQTKLKTSLNSQVENVSVTTLILSILFEHFDLSRKFTWESLFDHWGAVDEVSTANLMCCCKWYLIWSLRNLSAENYAAQSRVLARACKEFTSTCFNMLHQHLNGQPLHFKTYDCLCDMYYTYMDELDEMIKSDKRMQRLKLVLDDEQLKNVMVSFLEQYVIRNATMPLSERRSHVVKYINLVHMGVLPIKSLANLFRYYHMYNKEYAPIIESSLSHFAQLDENTFLMVILYTSVFVYEKILAKHPVIDMSTQDVPNLKLLMKQFSNLKEFRPPGEKFMKLIFFSINYSVQEESRYPFLYFVKYFADRIVQESDKKDALTYLRDKLPRAAQKNDAVLFLASHLKSLKLGATASKPKPVTVPKKGKENVKSKKKSVSPDKSGPSSSGIKSGTVGAKNTVEKGKKRVTVDTETDISDDLTIHDSESDDFEESFSALKV